jgi:hypothetical protein
MPSIHGISAISWAEVAAGVEQALTKGGSKVVLTMPLPRKLRKSLLAIIAITVWSFILF